MAFGLTPWDPFRDMERLERLLRRPFEAHGRLAEVMSPAIELTDEGEHYLVKAELPGVDVSDVEVTLSGNVLTIRGEKRYERRVEAEAPAGEQGKKEEQKAEEKKEAAPAEGTTQLARPIFSEVFYGSFERTISLPDDIDPEKIEASSEKGVLSIRVGKKPEQRARRIEVTRH